MRAGGDVEEDHFVSPLLVIAQRQGDGIADITQFARFGFAELDAARHLAVMHVQAGDDSFREHCGMLNRFGGWKQFWKSRDGKLEIEQQSDKGTKGGHEFLAGETFNTEQRSVDTKRILAIPGRAG